MGSPVGLISLRPAPGIDENSDSRSLSIWRMLRGNLMKRKRRGNQSFHPKSPWNSKAFLTVSPFERVVDCVVAPGTRTDAGDASDLVIQGNFRGTMTFLRSDEVRALRVSRAAAIELEGVVDLLLVVVGGRLLEVLMAGEF